MKSDINYFRIDHKNSLEILSSIEESNLSLSVFTTIASVNENFIGNEINKYFNKLLKNNNSDLYDINLSQVKKYQTKYYHSDVEIELSYAVNDLLTTDYGTTFEFDENTTEDIMKILCYCFYCLETDKAKFNISTHEQMLSSISKVIEANIDAIKLFLRYPSNNNKDNNKGINDAHKADCFFTYPLIFGNYDKTPSFSIPIEMIILINKFQCIKKVEFKTEDITKRRKIEIVSILLNSHWLFPHMLEAELNLTDELVQRDINDIINRKLHKKCKRMPKKTTMYDFNMNKGFQWSPKEKEGNNDLKRSNNMNYNNNDNDQQSSFNINGNLIGGKHRSISPFTSFNDYITKNKKEFFEMIIIYSYFTSQMKYLKSLSIKIQDSYSSEIQTLLNNFDINLVDFHFLSFFNQLFTITEISLIFNSLDTQTFEEVIGLIHKNSYLTTLRLNLFNSDNNYTPASLFKLCTCLKMNMNDIFNENFFSIGEKGFENDEIDHQLINKLLPCFEENLEKLLFVLLENLKIQELIFYFDLPKIISNNDFYLMVLIKFIFNIFFLLSKEMHKYKEVKIISPELWFNCRKNPFIEEYLDEITLERNDEVNLTYLTVQLGFYHVENIGNFLFTKLEHLFIGDFDMETFEYFVKAYSEKEYIKTSNLRVITISLNKTINYSMIKNSILGYFSVKHQNLIEQNLITFIKMDNKVDAEEVVDVIYRKNKVKQICFELNEGGELLNQVLVCYSNVILTLLYVFTIKNKQITKNRERIVKSIQQFLFNSKPYAFKCRY